MKDLSIEEKAKRYDEAIERAEGLIDFCSDSELKTLEFVFTELKESEDEKIRKALISHYQGDGCICSNNYRIDYKDICVWLEKQGEPIDKIVKRAMNEKQRVLLTETNGDANIDWNTRSLQDVKLLLEYGLDYIKKLEKQDRQKETLCDKCRKEQPSHSCQDITASGRCALEKQGEQKFANKVEPKFHEGNWVVIDGEALHIIEVTEDGYLTDEGGHIPFRCNKEVHIWSIADAKDGDVLVTDDGLAFIYNEYLEEHQWPFAYGGINIYGRFGICNGLLPFTHQKVVPATKEQRDLLFQKMKEAGYEWDTEKKEPREIENPTVWSEEDIADVFEKVGLAKIAREQSYDNLTNALQDAMIELSKFIPQQNYAWSEKDEREIKHCIDFLNHPNMIEATPNVANGCKEWLKSLKDRVQPQNSYNPYKEVVESIAEMCKHYDKVSHSYLRDFYDNVKVKCKDAKEYDSLYPHNAWKPSDEQMRNLKYACNNSRKIDIQNVKVLKSLYNDLKKLKGE